MKIHNDLIREQQEGDKQVIRIIVYHEFHATLYCTFQFLPIADELRVSFEEFVRCEKRLGICAGVVTFVLQPFEILTLHQMFDEYCNLRSYCNTCIRTPFHSNESIRNYVDSLRLNGNTVVRFENSSGPLCLYCKIKQNKNYFNNLENMPY